MVRREAVHRERYLPLDSDCEVVAEYLAGGSYETWAAFARRHRAECERCKLYGIENMTMDETPLSFTVPVTRPAVAAWRFRVASEAEARSTKSSAS